MALAAAPTSATNPPTPSAFDLWEQTRAVATDQINQEGNVALWNVPATDVFSAGSSNAALLTALDKFGPEQKGEAAARNEEQVQDQISHFWATRQPGPLSQTEQNTLEDLKLQQDADQQSKIRRAVSIIGLKIPGTGAGLSSYYERSANQDSLTLAQNQESDAEQAIAKSGPSQANDQALHNARLSVTARREDRDANTLDLLGNVGGLGKFGPVLRAKASVNDVAVALHKQKAAQETYTKTPNQMNGMKVQIANLGLRAARAGHESDKDEVADSSLGLKSGFVKIISDLGEAAASQSQTVLLKRAARLQRQVIKIQRAQNLKTTQTAAAASGNQVAQQLLALSNYGPATATTTTYGPAAASPFYGPATTTTTVST